jgi:hypothetical protein
VFTKINPDMTTLLLALLLQLNTFTDANSSNSKANQPIRANAQLNYGGAGDWYDH